MHIALGENQSTFILNYNTRLKAYSGLDTCFKWWI